MPPDRLTTISTSELVELRRKALAHDDYASALRLLKIKGYSRLLDEEVTVGYRSGYNAAILDMTEAVVNATIMRMETEA